MKAVVSKVRDTFGHLSKEELNWKQSPEKWSIAQCLAHLIIINETYYPAFNEMKAGDYSTPLIPSWGPFRRFTEKMVLKTVTEVPKKKIETFDIWKPTQSAIDSDIIERFAAHQDVIMSYFEELKDRAVNGANICSPANRKFVYSLEIAFKLILVHEKRHLLQAEQVLKAKAEFESKA